MTYMQIVNFVLSGLFMICMIAIVALLWRIVGQNADRANRYEGVLIERAKVTAEKERISTEAALTAARAAEKLAKYIEDKGL